MIFEPGYAGSDQFVSHQAEINDARALREKFGNAPRHTVILNITV